MRIKLKRINYQALATSVVALLIVILYWPVLHYGFFNLDDPISILRNPLITQTELSFKALLTATPLGEYAPFYTLINWILYQWGDGSAWPFHLASILLHATICLLLYQLLVEWLGSQRLAGLSVLLFAIHPIHSETVVWVSARRDLQAAFFMLLMFHSYMLSRSVRRRREKGWWYSAAILFYVVAVLSKVNALVAPLCLPLIDQFWPLAPDKRWPPKRSSDRLGVKAWAPFLLFGLMLFFITYKVAQRSGTIIAGASELWQRLLVTSDVLSSVYLKNLFLPGPMSIYYDRSLGTDLLSWGQAVTLCVALAIIAIIRYRKRLGLDQRFYMILGFGAIMMLPYLNFFHTEIAGANRYVYLASLPFYVLAAWLLERSAQIKPKSLWAGVLLLTIATVWVTHTKAAISSWSTPLRKWEEALKVNPNSYKIRLTYGEMLLRENQFDEAAKEFAGLIQSHHSHEALGYLALAKARMGKQVSAEADFQTYRKWNRNQPPHLEILSNYAASYLERGKPQQAQKLLEEVLVKQPTNAWVLCLLAKSHYRQAHFERAAIYYKEALRINPRYHDAWYDLALTYAKLKDWHKAREAWEQAAQHKLIITNTNN